MQAGRRLAALPVLAAVLATAVTLGGSFVFDDALISTGAELRAFDLRRIFWDNYWGDLRFDTNYRPLPLLTYALNFQLSEAPFGFHLVNVLLHGLVAWLAYRVLCELVDDRVVAAWGAALFGALSIRCEAVAWVVGRAEILAAIFVLTGMWIALRRPRAGPGGAVALAACAFLGCCSKENAVVLPALVVVAAWARGGPLPWKGALGAAAGVLAYVLLRQAVLAENFRALESGAATLLSRVDNPIHHDFVDTGTRVANAVRLQGLYLWKTLVPWHLSADYSFDALPVVPVASAVLRAEVALLVVFVAGGVWFFRRRAQPAGVLGALFFPLAFLVSSNLPFGIGTIFGERLAYTPSFGWPLVLCAGARLASARGPRARQLALGGLALLTVVYGARTAVRCAEWRDPATLHDATWASTPGSVRAQLLGAGAALERALGEVDPARRADELARALERAHRALEIEPSYGRAQAMVARVHLERGQATGAVEELLEAERWGTRALETMIAARQAEPDVLFRRGLARIGIARARLAAGGDAAPALEGARSDFDGTLAQAAAGIAVPAAQLYYYRGLAAAMLADTAGAPRGALHRAALADFDEALARDPAQPDLLHKRGLLRAQTGDLEGALVDFERGLAACEAAGRRFHPRAISAWTFAHELARVHERRGDAAAADRERARARSLRPAQGGRAQR